MHLSFSDSIKASLVGRSKNVEFFSAQMYSQQMYSQSTKSFPLRPDLIFCILSLAKSSKYIYIYIYILLFFSRIALFLFIAALFYDFCHSSVESLGRSAGFIAPYYNTYHGR